MRTPPPIIVDKMGLDLLQNPLYNKGTSWPKTERDRLGLRGLVPPAVLDIEVRRHIDFFPKLAAASCWTTPHVSNRFFISFEDTFAKCLVSHLSFAAR
jgi:hypothetical protein